MKGVSALMLSGGGISHSDFSSSEEDELNGHGSARTVQGTPGILHIKDLMGRGAFGSVYRATWKGLPAAVKVSTKQHIPVSLSYSPLHTMQRMPSCSDVCPTPRGKKFMHLAAPDEMKSKEGSEPLGICAGH